MGRESVEPVLKDRSRLSFRHLHTCVRRLFRLRNQAGGRIEKGDGESMRTATDCNANELRLSYHFWCSSAKSASEIPLTACSSFPRLASLCGSEVRLR